MTDEPTPEQASADRDHMAAIGMVAALWSGLEAIIDRLALSLGKIPVGAGYCFTAQVIGPARKLDAYLSVAKLRGASEELVRQLNKFTADTVKLAERRNRIIHDPWILDHPNTPERLQISARKTLVIERVPVETKDVVKFLDELEKHRKRFIQLHDRIKHDVGT